MEYDFGPVIFAVFSYLYVLQRLLNIKRLRLRLGIGVVLLLFGLNTIQVTAAASWGAQKELSQYAVTGQAQVIDHINQPVPEGDEDKYFTRYEYSVSDALYTGRSFNYATFLDAEGGQIPVVYSSRKPGISLPAREFTPDGAFRHWLNWYIYEDKGGENIFYGLAGIVVGAIVCLKTVSDMIALEQQNRREVFSDYQG